MEKSVDIRISNASLPRRSVGWRVADYERFFAAIGVEQGEFIVRNDAFFAGVALLGLGKKQGYEAQAVRRLVASVHQSFVELPRRVIARQIVAEAIRGPHNLALAKKLGTRAALATVYPERMASLSRMQHLQQVTGPLPAVVYPEVYDGGVRYAPEQFSLTMAQVTANWLGLRGLPAHADADWIMHELAAQGVGKVCLDVAHIQRQYPDEPYAFPDPLGLAVDLAQHDYVAEGHLALGRTDVGRDVVSYKAFVRSAAAAAQTAEGDMFVNTVHEWRAYHPDTPMPWVLEVNPFAVEGDMTAEYAAIVQHAYELAA